jgi:hypothetical protein
VSLQLFALLTALAFGSPPAQVNPPAQPATTEEAPSDREVWSAERWIAEVDARAAAAPGLRYSAVRTTQRGDVKVEERWRFILFGGDRFRIDYFGDTARQLTCDGRWLVDYIPAMGRAARWDLSALAPRERQSMLAKVLQKVSVPGLRLGDAKGVAWTMTMGTSAGRDVVMLDGEGQGGTTLHYTIDKAHLGVHAIRIVQASQTVLDARLSDHRPITENWFLPHEIHMTAPDEGGLATIHLRLTKALAIEDSPTGMFTTTLDPSIPIEEYP